MQVLHLLLRLTGVLKVVDWKTNPVANISSLTGTLCNILAFHFFTLRTGAKKTVEILSSK